MKKRVAINGLGRIKNNTMITTMHTYISSQETVNKQIFRNFRCKSKV